MAKWANLILRMVTRRAMGKTVRSITKNFKQNKKQKKRAQNQGEPVEVQPINYYKIAFQVLLLIALGFIFYLIIEKKISF